jgi:hypothetical protein
MTLYDYTENIPFANNAPKNDQPNMQINNNSISGIISEDHVGFGLDNGGFHTLIHMTEFSSTTLNPSNPSNNPPTAPAPMDNIGQFYTCQIRSPPVTGGIIDEVLYYQSAFGRITQLTNNITGPGFQSSTAGQGGFNGYTTLPGGLMLQWGYLASTTSSSFTQLNFNKFNIPFPNQCFNVWTQPYSSGSVPNSQATVAIRGSTVDQDGFEWVFVTNSGSYNGFYWAAIGN